MDSNSNTASFPSDLGGGQYGHLGYTIRAVEYNTLMRHTFQCPPIPGITLPEGDPFELQAQTTNRI
eukprot:424340-Ditylum_brightwellii.AAC.1